MSAATEWVDGLQEAIRNFSRSRRGTPVVAVHLTGESFNAQRVASGPGGSFVTFDAYPDVEPGPGVFAAMIEDREGEHHTARVVIVGLHEVRKVELLHAPAERRQAIGFAAAD